MKIIDCIQGSPEWIQARLGIPTASEFDVLMTKSARAGNFTPGMRTLFHCKLAEWALGRPVKNADVTGFMQRGHDLEDEAIAWYEFETGRKVERVGFVMRDDGMSGCSPDGLVGKPRGLEIKCLSVHEHVAALLGDAEEYTSQIQGGLWICDREVWDRLYFNPSLPPRIVEVRRDDDFIADLAKAVESFVARLLDARAKLEAMDCRPAKPKPVSAQPKYEPPQWIAEGDAELAALTEFYRQSPLEAEGQVQPCEAEALPTPHPQEPIDDSWKF